MSAAVLDLSTRRIKIYASAYDGTARAEVEAHAADVANPHAVTKAQVGLANADNTADADKPVSDAQAAALALKAPLASPALTGTPSAPTAVLGTVSTQLATTEFVQAAVNALDIPDVTGDLAAHLADTANPHGVTRAQVGLGAVDNTSDAAKPVSGPQQTAINVATAAAAAAQTDIDGHQANTGNPHGVTKSQVGLGAVDNTPDLAKPVSSAQQTAINVAAASAAAAQADIDAHAASTANPHGVTKAQVGLGNVDNTSDAAKPVSSATQIALNLKAPIASPGLTGTPTAPTAAPGTATTQLATTEFVATLPAIAANAAAAAAAQADADAAQAAAAAAQTAADTAQADAGAAQADATQALADAAAAQAAADAAQADADTALALIAGRAGDAARPGDAPGLFGQSKTGPAEDVVPIPPQWVVQSAAGNVVRIDLATVADPPAKTISDVDLETITTEGGSPVTTSGRSVFTTIAPAGPVAVETGRLYQIRWKVERQTDPVDPLNDAVQLGIAWLNGGMAAISSTVVENLALVVADGIVERSVLVAFDDPRADIVAPGGAVYFRPFVDAYGDWHVTDVIVLGVEDASSGVGGAPLILPLLDADPVAGPGVGLLALYGVRNIGGSATLRMQAGTSAVPQDIVVIVGMGA